MNYLVRKKNSYICVSNFSLTSVKLFADDTSLFSTVYDSSMSTDQPDKDLKKISDWAYNGKLSLIQTYLSKHKKLYFPEKLTR